MTAGPPVVVGLRVTATLLVLFLTGMGFLSLAVGTEPARRANPALWTPLLFVVAALGLAYAWAIWKVRPGALWVIAGSLVLITGLLWQLRLSLAGT